MTKSLAPLREWIVDSPSPEVRRSLDRLRRLSDAEAVAVMPDLHLSKNVCVGTVLATTRNIYPQAVGSDPGCGVASLPLGVAADFLRSESVARDLLHEIDSVVPILRHRSGKTPEIPKRLVEQPLSAPFLQRRRLREGCSQFATLGRGNHFVEFQSDRSGQLWLTVHTGSRAMGVLVRDHHAVRDQFADSKLVGVATTEAAGLNCLRDLEWTAAYARASRRAIQQAVIAVLSRFVAVDPEESRGIDTCHNFVRRECHQGRWLWIHRKGAQSAYEGELGVIPGSMGAPTIVVEGRGNPRSLHSCSHGAGRNQSRSEARRRISSKDLVRQMRGVMFDQRRAARLVDEAPTAYRCIDQVMRAQRDLVRQREVLQPLLVYKGG